MTLNEVLVTHPGGVKRLLLQALRKGTFYGIGVIPDWRFQTPILARDPKAKMERLKAFASGYALSNVVKYEEALSRVVSKLFGWMDRFSDSGKLMDLDRFFTFTTFDVVGKVLFSKEFGFIGKGEDIGNSISNNAALQGLGTPVSQFRWLQLVLGNPLVTILGLSPGSMLFRHALETLVERQKNPDARFNVVAHWFRYLNQYPDRTNFRNIEAQTTMNVGAGSDTVSCGLQSTIYHMIRNPRTWQAARAEILEAQVKWLCLDKVVSYTDSQQLDYLQACIKEGLRIHSPVPMGLPRVSPKGGIEVGGRYFPEGTTLSINPWVLHRNKEIWGADANEYRPERWSTPEAARLEKFFIPFGAGYMSYPGQHIARMELLKICSTIIRDYKIELVDPSKEWKWKAYFTMVPTTWPVYVSKRQEQGKQDM